MYVHIHTLYLNTILHKPEFGTKLPGSPLSPGGPGIPVPVRAEEEKHYF